MKIKWFIALCIILYTNTVFVFAQTDATRAEEARRRNGTQQFYDFGYNLGMEMMRDASRIKYTIVNSTDASIQEIYISSSNSDSWGANQWTSQELFLSGYEVEAKSDDVGPYDFCMVDTNGNKYIKGRVRITSDLVVIFTREDRVKKDVLDRLKNAWDSFWN
jgi:hypothetical protein